MTLRGGYLTGIGILVLLQLMTAFGAIGLLTRMSPAVEEILAENVVSNEAAEDAVTALALALADARSAAPSGVEEELLTERRTSFESAIERARRNVTEDEERAAIDELQRAGQRVLEGDATAAAVAVDAADRLIAINRTAMQEANARAQRLGSTGAWAAVALALTGFFVSILVVRRTVFGVVEPVEELEATLDAYEKGDSYRRCQGRAASQEMRRVLGAVNTLLDRANRVTEEKLDSSDD